MITSIVSSWLIFFAMRLIVSSFRAGEKWLSAIAATGVRFSIFHISYETRYFNHFFFSYFNAKDAWRRRLYTKWFDVGSVCMAVGQIVSLMLLTASLGYSLQSFFSQTDVLSSSYSHSRTPSMRGAAISTHSAASESSEVSVHAVASVGRVSVSGPSFAHSSTGYTPTIAPIIPGYNFPIEYVVEFWLVTFCVIVVHEFGHAAAASLERLQVQGCGTFFLFLFPGAYVKIEESVMYLPVKSQLRIYSAGVLHNLALAALSVLLVLNLPLVLWCVGFSTPRDSLVVVNQDPMSVLRGHIRVGDRIGFINDKPVTSLSSLSDVLTAEHQKKPFLTSVPFGSHGDSIGEQLQRQYDSNLIASTDKSHSVTLNDKVFYGSGVCVPHSFLDQAAHANAHQHRHHMRHHHSNTNAAGEVDPASASESSSLSCCHKILLKDYDPQDVTDDMYQSCFMAMGNADLHSGHEDYLDEVQLHCLSAKETLVPRVIVSSHGLQESSRQVCALDSDCGHAMTATSPIPYLEGDASEHHDKNDHIEDPLRCVHPVTASPVHLFAIKLLPGSPSVPSYTSLGSNPAPGKTILFEGTVQELMSNFELGEVDLFPMLKDNLNSWIYGYVLQIPKKIALCLWLSIQLNLSVAFMNMLPVFSLDGGLACPQFARILFPKSWSYPAKAVQYFGSFLLCTNLFLILAYQAKTFLHNR
mmetsp:Transcript_13889/g.25873  ORF Transcript_13889/g.25873 Transcript_13889/m.25873 type:complete len:696 (-) Transcript_13889:38-2125(-)